MTGWNDSNIHPRLCHIIKIKRAGVSPEREARAAKRSLEGCVRRTTPRPFFMPVDGHEKRAGTITGKQKGPAASYSRAGGSRTTLGDGALDCRVRNGNGYDCLSMATGPGNGLVSRGLKRTTTRRESGRTLSHHWVKSPLFSKRGKKAKPHVTLVPLG